jgi:hypothetical protein
MHFRIFLFVLLALQITTGQAQETPVEVNWPWFFETSTLLYFGAFETAEGQLRSKAPTLAAGDTAAAEGVTNFDYNANIAELDTRSQDVVVLLTALNLRQQQYVEAQRPVPLDLAHLIISTRSLYVGLGALRNFYSERKDKSDELKLELLYLAESSYNTHQLAYVTFSAQKVEGVKR